MTRPLLVPGSSICISQSHPTNPDCNPPVSRCQTKSGGYLLFVCGWQPITILQSCRCGSLAKESSVHINDCMDNCLILNIWKGKLLNMSNICVSSVKKCLNVKNNISDRFSPSEESFDRSQHQCVMLYFQGFLLSVSTITFPHHSIRTSADYNCFSNKHFASVLSTRTQFSLST